MSDRPTPHLDAVKQQRDEAIEACKDLGMAYAAQVIAVYRARRERDGLTRHLDADHKDAAEARRLLEYALHLRQHGENAPGGNETWAQFDRDAEHFLRWGAGGADAPQAVFGRDAGPEWEHPGDCSWPERACTGHAPSYPPVQVPENTGKHEAKPEPIGSNPDIFCFNPACPNYGDPDFGEATCPSDHADPTIWGSIAKE